jgi:hypothetical protein
MKPTTGVFGADNKCALTYNYVKSCVEEHYNYGTSGGTCNDMGSLQNTGASNGGNDAELGASTEGGPDGILIGVSCDFTIATPAGGYTFEIGIIASTNGKDMETFISQGSAYGWELSAGMNIFILVPATQIEDFEGTCLTASYNFELISASLSTSNGDYVVFKFGIGPGKGGSISCTNTTYWGTPNITWNWGDLHYGH